MRAGDRMALDGPRLLRHAGRAGKRRGDVELGRRRRLRRTARPAAGRGRNVAALRHAARGPPARATRRPSSRCWTAWGRSTRRCRSSRHRRAGRLAASNTRIGRRPAHVSRWQDRGAAAGSYWQRNARPADVGHLRGQRRRRRAAGTEPPADRRAAGAASCSAARLARWRCPSRCGARSKPWCGAPRARVWREGPGQPGLHQKPTAARRCSNSTRAERDRVAFTRTSTASRRCRPLRACRQGWLPVAGAADRDAARPGGRLRAPCALLSAAAASGWPTPATCDLPTPGGAFEPERPAVHDRSAGRFYPEALARRRDNLLDLVGRNDMSDSKPASPTAR